MTEFFSWIESASLKYVVLRGFEGFKNSYPSPGSKNDIDLLVEDHAIQPIQEKYGAYGRRQGTKCDIYDVHGNGIGGYLGGAYFPPKLSEATLGNRYKWNNLFYVPSAQEHLLSLLYHIAYQKAERSNIDGSNPEKSRNSKYVGEIESLQKQLNTEFPLTLNSFHGLLKEHGCPILYEPLVRILENDFKTDYKSFFRASVCAENHGEMNLFVIRSSAFKKKYHEKLMSDLKNHYNIILSKNIPWYQRYMRAHKMRGGKWRRGGYPAIAVVVYDPAPAATTQEERQVHPHVFNSKQFIKRTWREWYTRHTGAKPSVNPIHSTDNEAEAIGHLPFFFSDEERAYIYQQLKKIREA